jgi:hypothetical protein
MSQSNRGTSRRVWIALIAVAALAVGVSAALDRAEASLGQVICTYYSDATFTTEVGARGMGCCGVSADWGVTSAFERCETIYCFDVLCPQDPPTWP